MFGFPSEHPYWALNPDYAWVTAWACAMLRAAGQGAVAILVAWTACRALSKMPAGLKCWLWRLAILKLLLALVWTSPVDLPLLNPPVGRMSAALTSTPATPHSNAVSRSMRRPTLTRTSIPRPPLDPPYLQCALLAVWLVVVIAGAAHVVGQARAIRRLRRESRPLDDTPLYALLLSVCQRIGITRQPQLMASESAERPMLMGILRPAIVLPNSLVASVTSDGRSELELILAHELTHLKRRDLGYGWLLTVAAVLFAFHPLMRLAAEEWRVAHESACDELVLVKTNVPAGDYARMLVKIAESRPWQRAPMTAVSVVESYGSLRRRLLAMTTVGRHRGTALVFQVAFVMALGLTTLIPWRVVAQSGGTWMTKAPMPTPRCRFGLVEVNGMLYAIGGYGVGSRVGSLNELEVYDPRTDTWSTKSPMPTARHQLTVGVINGLIYVAGGFNALSTPGEVATLEVYDPATDNWTTRAPMLAVQGGPGAVVNGKLYVIGGTTCLTNGAGGTHTPAVATVQCYDPATDSWTFRQSMPTPRCHLAVVAHGGLVYALGGCDTTGYIKYATVEAYDPATDTWTSRTPMPTARDFTGAGSLNGLLYAVGGWTHGQTVLSCVEVYDPASDSWTAQSSMEARCHGHGVAVVNGKLYRIGGGDGGPSLETNAVFTPSP